MNELYEKLAKIRDKNRGTLHGKIECEVLSQLISLAFKNEFNPDKLPTAFTIANVNLSVEEIESLMESIGYTPEIILIKSDYDLGNSFNVTLK